MKVLVAYDGSLNSKDALKYGMDKAGESGGELTALHVFNSAMFIDYGAGPRAEEKARKESEQIVEEMKRLAEKIDWKMKVKAVMEEGYPEDEIVKYAGLHNCELIVCPARYGKIAKKAPCPVVLVPSHEQKKDAVLLPSYAAMR